MHESPTLITFPLIVLAALAAVGGLLGLPEFFGLHHWLKGFLSSVFVANPRTAETNVLSHSVEIALMVGAFIGTVLSIGYAYVKYVKGKALPLAEGKESGFGKIIYNKYYVDEAYHLLFVRPAMLLSEVFYDVIDKSFIDGAVNRSGRFSMLFGAQVRKLQSGYIGFYLLAMVLSIVAMLVYAFIIR